MKRPITFNQKRFFATHLQTVRTITKDAVERNVEKEAVHRMARIGAFTKLITGRATQGYWNVEVEKSEWEECVWNYLRGEGFSVEDFTDNIWIDERNEQNIRQVPYRRISWNEKT